MKEVILFQRGFTWIDQSVVDFVSRLYLQDEVAASYLSYLHEHADLDMHHPSVYLIPFLYFYLSPRTAT
jgi:hypothetical protein